MLKRKERRNFERVTLDGYNPVTLSSIGSDIRYELQTKNFSNQGLFLICENPERFPFCPSSIIKVWLDIGEGHLVFFNAKMMRFFSPLDNQASLWGEVLLLRLFRYLIRRR